MFQSGGEVMHIRVNGRMDCTDGAVLHQWCLEGRGIAWRSYWEVGNSLKEGKLVALLEEYAAPPNGIFAVFTQRKHQPLRLRLWLDYLKLHFSQAKRAQPDT